MTNRRGHARTPDMQEVNIGKGQSRCYAAVPPANGRATRLRPTPGLDGDIDIR